MIVLFFCKTQWNKSGICSSVSFYMFNEKVFLQKNGWQEFPTARNDEHNGWRIWLLTGKLIKFKRTQYIFLYGYAVWQLMVSQGLRLHFSIMTSYFYPLGCLAATRLFNFHISFFDVARNRNLIDFFEQLHVIYIDWVLRMHVICQPMWQLVCDLNWAWHCDTMLSIQRFISITTPSNLENDVICHTLCLTPNETHAWRKWVFVYLSLNGYFYVTNYQLTYSYVFENFLTKHWSASGKLYGLGSLEV